MATHRKEKFIYLEHLALELNSPICGLYLAIENNTMEDNSEEMLNQLNYCEIFIQLTNVYLIKLIKKLLVI